MHQARNNYIDRLLILRDFKTRVIMNTLGEAGLLMQIHERDRVKERRSETNWKSHYTLKAAFPSLFGTRDRLRGRQFFHGPGGGWVGKGSGGNASSGEQLMKLRCCPLLAPCCAAHCSKGPH